ncbi:uncharacterized protein LOC122574454 [Bombus pyrosoma]|uniref:uncharacterized protein LOC122574454 n=1 Tax=Bombus pyrosoma TaxID=396416 RepID=UPI001CB8EC76|nr:uncharacterized protein LOC122574454 [Bombus pyrosoma]
MIASVGFGHTALEPSAKGLSSVAREKKGQQTSGRTDVLRREESIRFSTANIKSTGSLVNIAFVAHVRRLIPPNSRNAIERDQEKEQTDRRGTRKGRIKRSSVENRNKICPK